MSSQDAARSSTKAGCPICGKPQQQQFRPFCSRRCADVDLYRWLSGAYAAPAAEAEGDEEDDGVAGENSRDA